MTNQEKLKKLQEQQEKLSGVDPKAARKDKRRKIVLGVLIGGTILVTGVAAISSNSNRHSVYEAYLNDPAAIQFDALDYEDTFDRWNQNDLGNDVNVLLSGGQIYSRGNTHVVLADEGTGYIIMSGENKYVTDYFMSYINVVGNTVYFRDDSNKNICAYNLEDQKASVLIEGNVGEVFVYNGKIYYTNLDNGSKIYCCNLDASDNKVCVDFATNDFAICGNTAIVLGNDQSLKTYALDSATVNTLASHIERFAIDKEIYCDSGNTILKFKPDGTDASEVLTSDKTLQLVSVENDIVYYLEDGTFKKSSDPNGSIDKETYEYVSSLVTDEDGSLVALGYACDENGQAHCSEIRVLGGAGNGEGQ